ncbi:hypothetical protein BDR26DRAFT_930166 [Obelidium mucronatum]|nr:hypothetical protein BDR26DRAFT_930166 [Obelidium mucronatum]
MHTFTHQTTLKRRIQTHIEKRVEIEQHNLSLLAIVVTPETHSEASTVLAQFTSHNILKPCIGLHPVQHVINNGETISISAHESQLDEVLALIQAKKDEIVAVGEIGLDFSPWILNASAQAWNCSVDQVKAIQRKVFERQVLLAKELDLAVNVHSRNAGHHAIAILEENGMLGRCLLHAFDGAPKHAVRAAQLGAMFSIPGSIARDTSTKKLVEKLEAREHLS